MKGLSEPISIEVVTRLQASIAAIDAYHGDFTIVATEDCHKCALCCAVVAMKIAINEVHASVGLDALYPDVAQSDIVIMSEQDRANEATSKLQSEIRYDVETSHLQVRISTLEDALRRVEDVVSNPDNPLTYITARVTEIVSEAVQ